MATPSTCRLWLAVTLVIALTAACTGPRAHRADPSVQAPAARVPSDLPMLHLPAPAREQDRIYLGLADQERFTLADIAAPVVLVEIYSLYCPHCQREAPEVNRLYRLIEERPELAGRIRIIGIGWGNSPMEVSIFQDTYQVPFPLFADPDGTLGQDLRIRGTPTFVGFVRRPDGGQRYFLHRLGRMKDVDGFLDEVIRQAGLGEES